MIQLIYAYAPTKSVSGGNEYAFGLDDGLPWGHIKRDMENFAKRTAGTVLIMGAKTFASLPGILAGREHVVVCDPNRDEPLTKNGQRAHAYIDADAFYTFLNGGDVTTGWSNGITACIACYQRNMQKYSIIGGAHILQYAYPYADKVIQTTIRKLHRVNSTVQLPLSFIVAPGMEDSEFTLTETTWIRIDELTDISESVYEKGL